MDQERIDIRNHTVRRVYTEFAEMPGMRLTLPQAQRLFGLSATECAAILEWLVATGHLRQLPNGCYACPVDDARAGRGLRRPLRPDLSPQI